MCFVYFSLICAVIHGASALELPVTRTAALSPLAGWQVSVCSGWGRLGLSHITALITSYSIYKQGDDVIDKYTR